MKTINIQHQNSYRLYLMVGLMAVLFVLALLFYRTLDFHALRITLESYRSYIGFKLMFLIALIYIVLLMVPYFPGLEVGLILMCVFGKEGVVLTYFSTLVGLSLAYSLGRGSVHSKFLKNTFSKLTAQADNNKNFKKVTSNLKKSWFGQLTHANIDHPKYSILLAILLNLPGNSLLGGGGGISFWYGFKQLLSGPRYILVTAIAVLPIPLLAFFGWIQLEKLF